MHSQNGWPVHTTSSGLLPLRWITGRVLPGDVHTIFDYLCRRFHAEVEPITVGHSWGYAYRAIRGASSGYSNHASATALDLNAPAHPLGAVNTFTPGQRSRLRAILRDLDGVVRWGGDYAGRKDEMHFEINASAAAVAAVARSLNKTTPTGGFMADMSEKEKRELLDGVKDTKQIAATIKNLVDDRVIDGPAGKPKEQDELTVSGALRRLLIEGRAHAKANAAAIEALAKAVGGGLDGADVLAIVDRNTKAALEGLEITLTTEA